MATYEKIITHNLYSASAATGVVTQFWSDSYKILPFAVKIDTGDQLTATFTHGTSATNVTAVVRVSDYTHTQTTPSTTWNINHNLNNDALISQTFSGKEEILPLSIQHDYNDSTITFSESISGTAEFIWIQTTFGVYPTITDPSGLSLSTSGSYWKVGTGTTESFNPMEANDIETIAVSGSFTSYYESTLDSDIVILEFDVPIGLDINITEIGIFNDDDRMMFYTECSPLFKPSNAILKLFYKITKFS